MPDKTSTDPTPVVAPGTDTQAPEIPDLAPDILLAALDRAFENPDHRSALTAKLKSHRTIAGIAGEIVQRDREVQNQAAAKTAVEAEQARIRKLAQEDPDAFASEWLEKATAHEANQKLADIRNTTRTEFISQIGKSLKDLPEFAELSVEDHGKLARALVGVAEDDLLSVFTRTALDLVADKRSEKKSDAKTTARLADEKKAWEAEQRTNVLKKRPSTDSKPAPVPSASSGGEPDFKADPAGWDLWYKRKYLGRAS